MQQLKRGDILLRKGEEYKVSFANEDFAFLINKDDELFMGTYTQIEEWDYTLKKEKWVPGVSSLYYYVNDVGDICTDIWEGGDYDTYRLKTGNVHETESEAEAWGKKAVELLKTIK